MKFIRSIVASSLTLFLADAAIAATASPLDTGAWYQVARMSDSDAGVFDGNGELQSDYTFGTYTSENQIADFARSFDVYDGMDIVFITGNGAMWALSDYATLRTTIDARAGTQNVNFRWDTTSLNAGGQDANILSRNGAAEDPWISWSGAHSDGVNSTGILWGENDWSAVSNHGALKNSNGGVNVWVSVAAPIPVPASGVLLLAGFGGLAVVRRKRR